MPPARADYLSAQISRIIADIALTKSGALL